MHLRWVKIIYAWIAVHSGGVIVHKNQGLEIGPSGCIIDRVLYIGAQHTQRSFINLMLIEAEQEGFLICDVLTRLSVIFTSVSSENAARVIIRYSNSGALTITLLVEDVAGEAVHAGLVQQTEFSVIE